MLNPCCLFIKGTVKTTIFLLICLPRFVVSAFLKEKTMCRPTEVFGPLVGTPEQSKATVYLSEKKNACQTFIGKNLLMQC